MSRYPPLAPSELHAEQKVLYDMAASHLPSFSQGRFAWKNREDALIGPFGPLIHTPEVMKGYAVIGLAIEKIPGLSPQAKETVILAVGSVFKAKFELYAHSGVARANGLTDNQIASIVEGWKPEGEDKLNDECEVAFEVARGLAGTPGPLPEGTWSRACKVLGKEATLALIHVTGLYAYTCILLNGADVPVPKEDEA